MNRAPYIPAWLAEEASPPKFHIRAGSIMERDEFEGQLEGEDAGAVYPFQMQQAAIEGLTALLSEDEAAGLVELVRADMGGEDLSPADRAKLKTTADLLTKHWPEYRELRQREARRNNLLRTLAFMRWCDGWENVTDDAGQPVAYERDRLGVIPDEVLRRIPFLLLRAAGWEAYARQYGRIEAKN